MEVIDERTMKIHFLVLGVVFLLLFAGSKAYAARAPIVQSAPAFGAGGLQVVAPSNPAPVAPFCDSLRQLPLPSGIPTHMFDNIVMFDKYVAYSAVHQQTYSMHDLLLLDMGNDGRPFTNDDAPLQNVPDTMDATIHGLDISSTNLVWVQDLPGFPSTELKTCRLPNCELSGTDNIFSQDPRYRLTGPVSTSGSKITAAVYDIVNHNEQVMFCDLSRNGNNGGCLLSDQKSFVNLNLPLNERISEIKTTENYGYIITETQALVKKVYIVDYTSLAFNLYYDSSVQSQSAFLRDIEPVAQQQRGLDVVYMIVRNSLSVDYIFNGNGNFAGRTSLPTNGNAEFLAPNKNTQGLFEFAYLSQDPRSRTYSLNTFVPNKIYSLDSNTYNQLRVINYNGMGGFASLDFNSLPTYTYCR